MASRTMHLAVSSLIASDISVRDAGRFKFGVILPDAEDGRYGDLTHFKTTDADGKKRFDLGLSLREFGNEVRSDDLYLGYYLHLVQDAVYRYLIYEKYAWDPRIPGNPARLHNDYALTNAYVVKKYGLEYDNCIPGNIGNERIIGTFPFIIDEFFEEMKGDFLPAGDGDPFFLTYEMTDEYISLARRVCLDECAALVNKTAPLFDYSWR